MAGVERPTTRKHTPRSYRYTPTNTLHSTAFLFIFSLFAASLLTFTQQHGVLVLERYHICKISFVFIMMHSLFWALCEVFAQNTCLLWVGNEWTDGIWSLHNLAALNGFRVLLLFTNEQQRHSRSYFHVVIEKAGYKQHGIYRRITNMVGFFLGETVLGHEFLSNYRLGD
ncbi:hypothetical protein V8F06_000013 [Rhypophila decipiens]